MQRILLSPNSSCGSFFFFKDSSWEDSSQVYICYKHILRTFDSGEKSWTEGLGTSSNLSPVTDYDPISGSSMTSSASVPSSFNVFPIYTVGNQFDFLNNLSNHSFSYNFVITNRLSISHALQISYHSWIWATFSPQVWDSKKYIRMKIQKKKKMGFKCLLHEE